MEKEDKQLLIIDTDAGTDDALALIMALKNSNWKVIAITSVHGNVNIQQASSNVLRILNFFDRTDIPVYQGCNTSLVEQPNPEHQLDYHGVDGLGCISDQLPLPSCPIQDEPAAAALVRLAKRYPKKITVIAIGPLTNLALALRLDPLFSENLKSLVIMGGNTEGNGNTTASAEFNFFWDPEGANVTLREFKCPMLIVGWEVCVRHLLPWDWYKRWISKGTKASEFIRKLTAREVEFNAAVTKWPGLIPCDLMAMTVMMYPHVMTKCEKHHVSVELQGKFTRGAMIVDRRPHSTEKTNATICEELDMREFQIVLDQMVA